jgi:hypothetical protein
VHTVSADLDVCVAQVVRVVGFSLHEEVCEQLLHDLGLVDHHYVVRIIDQFDPRLGQLLPGGGSPSLAH